MCNMWGTKPWRSGEEGGSGPVWILRGCQGRASHIGPLCTLLTPTPIGLPFCTSCLLPPVHLYSEVPALLPFVSRFLVFSFLQNFSLSTSFLHTHNIPRVTCQFWYWEGFPLVCEIRWLRSFIYIVGVAFMIALNDPLRHVAQRPTTDSEPEGSFKMAKGLPPFLW